MKNFFLWILVFSLFFWSVFALEIIISWTDDWYYNDSYKFDTSANNNIYVLLIDKFNSLYEDWNRISIIQNYDWWNLWHDSYINVWTWILKSELYWDFYLREDLKLLNDNDVNSNCNNVSYSYVWKLYSPSFWDLEIQDWSYYCPLSWSSSLILNSSLLWNIVITWNNLSDNNLVLNSRWESISVSNNMVFDDKKISVNWLQNINNEDSLSSDYSDNNSVNLNYWVEWKMAEFNQSINKNLVKYTNWITPLKDKYNDINLNWFSKKVHYYDFENQEDSNFSNINNKWVILTIWEWWTDDSFYKMWISWQKLLYVKWWNVYINADISNNTSTSQLVIVVKRDSNNRQNWWNVYINPEVTNIDAVIIADWSIISYNWTDILNAEDNTNALRKQLLIYWSISTKNTFWEDIATYWTDDYIDNWWIIKDNINTYNLAKLRSFQTMLNDDVLNWNCKYLWNSEIVSMSNISNSSLEYAFAWKKKCFLIDETLNWLRWTEKLTPLVIEYNPSLQTSPHFILEK